MAEPGINYTENYNLAKPEQGYKNWGTPWNENADKIDAALKNVKTPGNIGDIKYSILTEAPPGGAWCDGAEYTQAMFPDIYQMLVDNEIVSKTYTEYSNTVNQQGFCDYFALDKANNKFKVPTIPDGYVIGINDTLPVVGNGTVIGYDNGTTLFGTTNRNDANYTFIQNSIQAYGAKTGDIFNASIVGPLNAAIGLTTDSTKSGIVTDIQKSKTSLKAYVVLYSSAAEASEAQAAEFMTALGGKANVALDNVAPAQSFKDMSVGWGMPDYGSAVAVSFAIGTSYTAPCDCLLSLRAYGASQNYVYGKINRTINTGASYASAGESLAIIPLNKGDTFKITNKSSGSLDCKIIPCKGVNNA